MNSQRLILHVFSCFFVQFFVLRTITEAGTLADFLCNVLIRNHNLKTHVWISTRCMDYSSKLPLHIPDVSDPSAGHYFLLSGEKHVEYQTYRSSLVRGRGFEPRLVTSTFFLIGAACGGLLGGGHLNESWLT